MTIITTPEIVQATNSAVMTAATDQQYKGTEVRYGYGYHNFITGKPEADLEIGRHPTFRGTEKLMLLCIMLIKS